MNIPSDSWRRLGFAMTLIQAAGSMRLWSDRHSRHPGMAQSPNASARIPTALLRLQLVEVRQRVLPRMRDYPKE